MKDEIKEILELFGSTDENVMFGDIVELNSKQSHLLLDYITNLQQSDIDKQLEIMKLRDKLEQQRKEYQETYKDVRIELKEKDETITNLQEELKSANESITWWTNRFKAVERDKKDYKSRCEKAIEKLKYYKAKPYNEYDVDDVIIDLDYILNGGNEE